MTQRINICFEGLIATIASTPSRAKSETHLHTMIGHSLGHLSAQACGNMGSTLSDHVRHLESLPKADLISSCSIYSPICMLSFPVNTDTHI